MAGKNGTGNTRRILILIIAVCDAVSTAALALFHDSMERGLAVALGYAILFLTAFLMNLCIAGKATSIKEISALVFSIVLLALVISAIAFILFNADDDTTPMFHAEEEERPFASHPGMGLSYNEDDTAEKEEDVINIPSPPTVFNTITINKEATDIPEPSEFLITEKDDEIMIPSVPEVFGMVRNVDTESEVSIPSEPEVFGLIRDTEITEEPVVIPSVPEMFGVIREVDKDSAAPIVPVIIPAEKVEEEPNQEETYGYYNSRSSLDDEFWASFYIEGEDELVLTDGIYYMDLYINEVYMGDAEVLMENGEASLSVSELEDYTYGTLTDASKNRIFLNRGDYISLSELEESGVKTYFDSVDYVISLTFSTDDMPVQILSIRNSGRRMASRPIAGGLDLDPAVFTLISKYNLTLGFRDVTSHNALNNFYGYFSSSNRGRLYDVNFRFAYSMNFSADSFRFRLASYDFYVDFPDDMIRLQWGEVDTNLLSPTGTGIGIRFEKSLAYAPDGYKSRKSFTNQVIVIEKTSDVEIFNEGRSIFRRTLTPGVYRLQDFILYTGANRILIRISPEDGSEIKEIEFDILYSSSLLSPGEVYYGGALAFSRNLTSSYADKAPNAFSVPLWNGMRIDYDFTDAVLSGFIRAGLSETLTLDATLALQNKPDSDTAWKPNASFAAEFTNANVLGTTRLSFSSDEVSDEDGKLTYPSFDVSLGHQITTGISGISAITLSASWDSPESWDFTNTNRLSLNAGLSGSAGIFGWNFSGYGSFDFSDYNNWTWTLTAGANITVSRNFYFSASVDLTDTAYVSPIISGRISGTFRFGGSNITASTGFDDISVRASGTYGDHSYSASITSYDPLDIHSYDLDAGYTYNGDRFSAGLDFAASDLFDGIGISANISTSTVFADGLFALSSTIPSNFLLVRQSGALKGNDISIGTAGSSSFAETPTTFGTALYDGLSSSGNTGLMIYSTGTDQFAASESAAININSSDNFGYVYRISAEDSFSVSGIVILPDGTIALNIASPLYSISLDNNEVKLSATENYLFTDSDGRFVVSGLKSGLYGFDVNIGDSWILYIFEVVSDDSSFGKLQMLTLPSSVENLILPDPYAEIWSFKHSGLMTSDEFFRMLYPERAEEAV